MKDVNGIAICGEYEWNKHTFLLDVTGQVWVILHGFTHKSGNITDKAGFAKDAKGAKAKVTWYC